MKLPTGLIGIHRASLAGISLIAATTVMLLVSRSHESDGGQPTVADGAKVDSPATETLYNGIVLTTPWPPEIRHFRREPMDVPYLKSPPKVISIDVGRQLLIDDFLIERTTLTRHFHQPEIHPETPVLRPDQPWEKEQRDARDSPMAMPFSDGVWHDPQDGLFKMWYMAGMGLRTCYAISHDGIHWEKPALDVKAGTNIVLDEPRDSTTVWLDLHESDSQRRFKMLRVGGKLWLHDSPDGIHWNSQPARAGEAPDRSTMFFNPFRKAWVFSLKGAFFFANTECADPEFNVIDPQIGTLTLPRMRRYREGRDLLTTAKSWPATDQGWNTVEPYRAACVPVMWVGADRLDAPRDDIKTDPQLYNLDAFPYESLMIGLFSIWRGVPPNYPRRDKINELCLGFSRDGFHWDRPVRNPFVGVSEDPLAWNYSNVQSSGGGCLVVGDQLYFYVSGRNARDIRSVPENELKHAYGSTGLAILRRDGFASMDAGDEMGTLETRPLRFHGSQLFVNAANPDGQLRVEVLDESGHAIEPFTLDRCEIIRCDSTCQIVRWREGPGLNSLAGHPVRFRFHLKQGKLYSFWVSPDQSGASHGYVAAGGPRFTGDKDTVGTAPDIADGEVRAKRNDPR